MVNKKKGKVSVLRKMFTITPRTQTQIDDIGEHIGAMSMSEVVRWAVAQSHAKIFPSYAVKTGTRYTPDEQATRKADIKEANERVEAEREKGKLNDIVDALNGYVLNVDGSDVCYYFQYSSTDRTVQSIPVEQLTPDLVDYQYQVEIEVLEDKAERGVLDYDLAETVEEYLNKKAED